MIRFNDFPPFLSAVSLMQLDSPIKAHAVYKSAKAGDKDAMLELVVDLAAAWIGGLYDRFKLGLLYVAPHAQEVTGDVLGNSRQNQALVAEKKFVRLVKEWFGDEFTEIFGIEPAALNANDAQYLVGFQSVDQLRNRLAAGEQEIDRRLRSKGIARVSEETSPRASTDQDPSTAGSVASDL